MDKYFEFLYYREVIAALIVFCVIFIGVIGSIIDSIINKIRKMKKK